MKNALISIMSIVALLVGIGCATFSKAVTPATIDKNAVKYVSNAKVADANEFAGWPSLLKAERLKGAVDSAHEVNLLAVKQLQERNELDYSILKGAVARNLEIARQSESLIFGETGLLSAGLSALGAGGLATVIAAMRKKSAVDAATAVATADANAQTEQAQSEVEATMVKLRETVKGVQSFIDANKGADVATQLKGALSVAQSDATKETVATIKATL